MIDDNEVLYLKFRRWVHLPNAFPTEPKFEGMAGMQALMEAALWEAYKEGYRACLADAQAALQRLPPPDNTADTPANPL